MAGGSAAIDGAAVAINSGNGASGSGGGGKQAGFVHTAQRKTLRFMDRKPLPSLSTITIRYGTTRGVGRNVKKMKEVWYYLL